MEREGETERLLGVGKSVGDGKKEKERSGESGIDVGGNVLLRRGKRVWGLEREQREGC